MNKWLLTPIQRYQAVIAYAHRLGRKIHYGTRDSDEALCKEQARHIFSRLMEPCNNPEHQASYWQTLNLNIEQYKKEFGTYPSRLRYCCPQCLAEFKEEIE